jgi:pyruvate kinase
MNTNPLRKTKIVCSLGPATSSDDKVRALIQAGMNVARFNFSHGTHEEHKEQMDRVKRLSAELDMPVALMLDTKGPEIRTGLLAPDSSRPGNKADSEGSGTVAFNTGDLVMVDAAIDAGENGWTFPAAGNKPGHISLTWKEVAQKVKPGVKILIADGLFELEVLSTDGKSATCRALNAAKIGSRKNVNIVGVHAGLPIMSEQDKSDLAFGAEQDVDCISASFMSFPHEAVEMREFLRSKGSNARIIAKIESAEGVDNIEGIIKAADGVMVARGDLAQQIAMERIPLVQKDIISLARRYGKPVITATQMLDSMIVNPRPTRAELTDVANAIFDGSDAVMLSGETASGAYPVAAVETMARIALTVEQSPEFCRHMRASLPVQACDQDTASDAAQNQAWNQDIASVISKAAYETALHLGAKAIVTPTLSGNTARLIARYRPEQPILAVTPNCKTRQTSLLDWGVFPILVPEGSDSEAMSLCAQKTAFETGLAGISDKLVFTAGLPVGSAQPLNTLRVLIMGNVLARSSSGAGLERVTGKLFRAGSLDEAAAVIKNTGGDILVCPVLNDDYIPIVRIVKGVVAEHSCTLSPEQLQTINPGLVWLAGVSTGSGKLESGLTVTLDGKALLVYEGAV